MKKARGGLLAVAVYMSLVSAQGPAPGGGTFKLGTFERNGRTFLGLVLEDTLVVDLAQANAAYQSGTAGAPRVAMPSDMKALIAQWADTGFRERLQTLARASASAKGRPDYVHEVKTLRTRPPIMYPTTMANAAVNYVEHANEMAGAGGARAGGARAGSSGSAAPEPPPESMPGMWQRQPGDSRHNPYLFLKPVSAVVGEGDAIRLPAGRDRIDWECELAVVIGKTASQVPVDRAAEYIFGFTLENDVSDRGGRGDRRHGSDWLIGKGHDTFAPMGPYVVPKEFVPDPQKLAIKFTLSGKVMQDSNTDRMTHTVYEMLAFASQILTLRAGDVIATGSPAGVGTARATPIYFKAGDVSVCSIEKIGTLTNPIVGPSTPPTAAR